MSDTLVSGIILTALAGLIMGTSPWPLKLLRRFQYEHFGFVSMLVALVIYALGNYILLLPAAACGPATRRRARCC